MQEKMQENNRLSIGRRVVEVAKQRGISQSKLAEKLNICQTTVSAWGKASSPSINDIVEIAEFLNVSVEFLLTGAGKDYFDYGEKSEILDSDKSASVQTNNSLLQKIDELQKTIASQQGTIDKLTDLLHNNMLSFQENVGSGVDRPLLHSNKS
jgi:transcriptional regulator with XRE-family HTH domain